MLGLFSILAGLGVMGVAVAVASSLVSGMVVLKFVVKFMVPDMEDATWKQCLICNVAMYAVFIGAIFCLKIPVDFVNGVAFILVLYFGQIAVVQGVFELKEGGATVLFFFNMMNVVVMYLVFWMLVGDVTKANEALVGGGMGGGMTLELAAELEEKKFEAEMRAAMAQEQAEEAERRAKIAAESVATPKPVTVVAAPDGELTVAQIFASTKVEKEDLPNAMQRSHTRRVLGLRVASKRPLALEGMRIGLGFEDASAGTSDCPLNNWPRVGRIYADASPPFKLVPAEPTGHPIHEGHVLNLDTREMTTLATEEGLQKESMMPAGATRHYYLFFATTVPPKPCDWYLYVLEESGECRIVSLGDAGGALRKR